MGDSETWTVPHVCPSGTDPSPWSSTEMEFGHGGKEEHIDDEMKEEELPVSMRALAVVEVLLELGRRRTKAVGSKEQDVGWN